MCLVITKACSIWPVDH